MLQLVRYVPDGSLCTASVEQIFPRDCVQRNCFEFALYIMTASPIASVRVFETVQRRRCRRATFGTLATLSVRDRAIIVLNDHRFWGYASNPSSSGNTLPSSIHCWHARAPRRSPYRASGFVHWHKCEVLTASSNVRAWGLSGRHMLAASLSQFDPDLALLLA